MHRAKFTNAIPHGVKLEEMPRSRNKGFCCEAIVKNVAGGGQTTRQPKSGGQAATKPTQK
ncbi:MAG: hypothetical protein R3C26_03165 [Calditrichia bacterium]